MAEGRRYALNTQLDIKQILLEAQYRWLRPAEICEILQNYKKFRIAPEPPTRPPSGSLFLFDRKVLRYFRKDGHNWRKKRDGKTVKEAHERLKAGSVDVLHCYYAHGEENEKFQRRSYWMLEEELSHIVLVHYREVKGNRTNFSRLKDADGIPHCQQTKDDVSYSEMGRSGASQFPSYDYQGEQVADTASLNSFQASEHEDAESAYKHQSSPGFHSVQELQSPTSLTTEAATVPYYTVSTSSTYGGQISTLPSMSFGTNTREKNKNLIDHGLYQFQQDHAFQSRENSVESTTGYQSVNFQPSLYSPAQPSSLSMMSGRENQLLDQVVYQQASVHDSQHASNWSMGQKSAERVNLGQDHYYPLWRDPMSDQTTKPNSVDQGELSNAVGLHNTYLTEQGRELLQDDLQLQSSKVVSSSHDSYSDGKLSLEDKTDNTPLKQPLLDGFMREGLKKLDSFDRWISKELDDVTDATIQPRPSVYWETVGSEDADESDISTHVPLDNYILSPSISQDQLFSVVDFSPNWAYSGTEIKVHVIGGFLRSPEEVLKCKWACMFGELEVPAEVVADGILQCFTPSHDNGRVPFYVTCSNRLACSEVREFEFRPIPDVDISDAGSITSDETLHMRFGKLLSLEPSTSQTSIQSSSAESSQLCRKISAMLKDDLEWEQMVNLTKQDEFSPDKCMDQLLQKLLKEKLLVWLLQKIAEGGKGPSILDEQGQGVLHFAAALGYDWAIAPTIAAGVNINFRDANGWTALHWAAHNGRERTVGLLISLGAAPGLVTDPTPKYPSGRPPADLASSNGHKGIAGYLAESSLSSHLSSITLKDSKGSDRGKDWVPISETSVSYGDLPLKDSLAAVRNATQAASRIHEVYRAQSFQRRQIKEYNDREFGVSDDRALSLLALRSKRIGQQDEPGHAAAAVRIQNKFRSWKGRKDFLLIRQQIIKIQAHVRGHQVRKNYRKIIWSVGILDKVILRWRRKGRGLKGFRPEEHSASSSMRTETQEDDYDYLKEGRKQTEKRLEKALARVKSMVQYPEARDQYRRVLNAVSEMQQKKAAYDKILCNPEGDFDDDLIDLDALLEDDTFMAIV
ncbi:calmodulin-binding transcription activator 3-like isoform X2 [Andrographis paniculata]|uniref:calmodulin-binding transcription activator 3-like isoform X2 n=1 Tax=Andrographis paniculata TaxID=175694 RepID=UPI0021E7B8A3|nr:calmodulin-binding transcription activator 3-like isoform X2 [Andrographis paniculata]